MADNWNGSQVVVLIGLAAAVLGLVGYVVFGWRFGEGGSTASTAIGLVVALIAVGWTLYEYVLS